MAVSTSTRTYRVESGSGGLTAWIEVPIEGLDNATVQLKWKVSDELTAVLVGKNALRPYALIVVIGDDNREAGRYVVPLEQGYQFVAFSRSGRNTVRLTVVWCNYGLRNVSDQLLERGYRGRYENDVLEQQYFGRDAVCEQLEVARAELARVDAVCANAHHAPAWRAGLPLAVARLRAAYDNYPATMVIREFYFDIKRLELEVVLEDIDVDPRLFAHNRSHTVWLAGLYDRTLWRCHPLANGCDRRKRASINAVISIPVAAVYGVLKAAEFVLWELAAIMLLLLGFRGVNLKFSGKRMPWDDIKPCRYVSRKTVKEDKEVFVPRDLFFRLVNPVTVVGLGTVGWILLNIGPKMLVVSLVTVAMLGIVITAAFVLIRNYDDADDRKQARHEADLQTLRELPIHIDDNSRGLKVRASTFKYKICRPLDKH